MREGVIITRLNGIKFIILLISIVLAQTIDFAAAQPTDQFIIPHDGQKDRPFHMAVIGDSVAWGNGLNKADKYYYQVADWLSEGLERPVDVKVYAHSGASIVNPQGQNGKRLNANLNSWYPTLMDQAYSIDNADNVDLILVSGGINDVDVMKIIDPYTPTDEIDRRSQSIKDPMKNVLSYLLNRCRNAKIIVTNYYPLITDDTEQDAIYTSFNMLSQVFGRAQVNLLDTLNHKSRLTENSYTFNGVITRSLSSAVKDADNGEGRICFALVNFQPSNGYGASKTWLWKLMGLTPPKTNDDCYGYRVTLCDPIGITNIFDKDNYINYINAMGHPNKDGAIEYARAIESAINGKDLGWLGTEISTTKIINNGKESPIIDSNDLPDMSQLLKAISSWTSMFPDILQELPTVPGWLEDALVILIALIIGGSLIRRSLWEFIMNSVLGLMVIYLSSIYLGIGIAINIPTLLICAIGGFPGAIILVALKYFYGITF